MCKHVRVKGLGFGGTIIKGKAVIIRVCAKCGVVYAERRKPRKIGFHIHPALAKHRIRRPVLVGLAVHP